MNSKIAVALVVSILISVAASVACTYLIVNKKAGKKQAYILTQQLFEDYKGTQVIKKKLAKIEEQQKFTIDSIALNIKLMESKFANKNDPKLIKARENFNRFYIQLNSNNKKVSEEYNAGIWKQINQYLTEYGKKNKYSFIYGADGSGSIMYADSLENVTKEVTVFINNKYAGE